MAAIHILPLPLDIGCEARAEAALMRAIESGIDLGARGQHIQALTLSLTSTLQMLRQATCAIPDGFELHAVEWQSIQANVTELTRTVERLTTVCQTFPM